MKNIYVVTQEDKNNLYGSIDKNSNFSGGCSAYRGVSACIDAPPEE